MNKPNLEQIEKEQERKKKSREKRKRKKMIVNGAAVKKLSKLIGKK